MTSIADRIALLREVLSSPALRADARCGDGDAKQTLTVAADELAQLERELQQQRGAAA